MNLYYLKTEARIQTAFLELRRRYDVSKISVRALCDCAEINRSTFYYHYRDVYDLSDTLEHNCIKELYHQLWTGHTNTPDLQEQMLQPGLTELSQHLLILFHGHPDRFYATVNDLFTEVLADDRLSGNDRIHSAIALQRVITLFIQSTTTTPDLHLITAHEQLFTTVLTAVERVQDN